MTSPWLAESGSKVKKLLKEELGRLWRKLHVSTLMGSRGRVTVTLASQGSQTWVRMKFSP